MIGLVDIKQDDGEVEGLVAEVVGPAGGLQPVDGLADGFLGYLGLFHFI